MDFKEAHRAFFIANTKYTLEKGKLRHLKEQIQHREDLVKELAEQRRIAYNNYIALTNKINYDSLRNAIINHITNDENLMYWSEYLIAAINKMNHNELLSLANKLDLWRMEAFMNNDEAMDT